MAASGDCAVNAAITCGYAHVVLRIGSGAADATALLAKSASASPPVAAANFVVFDISSLPLAYRVRPASLPILMQPLMFDRSVLDVNHTVVTCITTLPTANALVIISSPDERIRADTQHVIIAAASATIAVLTAVIALAALQNALVVLVFLSSSMLIGGAMGVTNNAYAEIISRMLTAARRNDLVLNQQALGAILTVAATLLLIPLLSNRDAVDSHLDLLWFGAAAMAVAVVAAMTVGPTTSGTVSPPRGMIEDLREGAAAVRTARWYRIFLTAQIVFAPIAVNETFFALRRFGYQPRCWREIGARAHDVGDRGVLLQHSRAAISAAVVDGVDVVAPAGQGIQHPRQHVLAVVHAEHGQDVHLLLLRRGCHSGVVPGAER